MEKKLFETVFYDMLEEAYDGDIGLTVVDALVQVSNMWENSTEKETLRQLETKDNAE